MNKHITIDPRVCNGKPVIKDTRIPVTVILDQLADTGSINGVLLKYPDLAFEQVLAALDYCHLLIENTEWQAKAA